MNVGIADMPSFSAVSYCDIWKGWMILQRGKRIWRQNGIRYQRWWLHEGGKEWRRITLHLQHYYPHQPCRTRHLCTLHSLPGREVAVKVTAGRQVDTRHRQVESRRTWPTLTWNFGAIIWHGPHQLAVKSTTTSLPPASLRAALKSACSKL